MLRVLALAGLLTTSFTLFLAPAEATDLIVCSTSTITIVNGATVSCGTRTLCSHVWIDCGPVIPIADYSCTVKPLTVGVSCGLV